MRNVLLSVALAFSGSEAFAPAGRWVAPGRAASSVPARPPRVAPLRAFLHEQRERPTKNEAPPDAVAPARVMPALAQGTCLVSGFFDDPSRVDQTVFDYLHKHDTFAKIVAFTGDVAFAQKRLVGRSARYTGLLDVLAFKQGGAPELPGALQGADCWVAFNVPLAEVAAQAAVAKAAGVKKLVVVAVAGSAAPDFADAAAALAGSSTSFTFLAVSALDDAAKEGGPIIVFKTPHADPDAAAAVVAAADGDPAAAAAAVAAFPSVCAGAFSRDEAIRFAAESVLLPPAHNSAFVLSRGDEVALNYTKGLRAKGYTRAEEVGFLMTGGYQAHILNVTAANAAAAKKAADALARKNAPVDHEAVAAAWKAKLEWQAGENKRDQDAKIVAKAQWLTDEAWVQQRYMENAPETTPSTHDRVLLLSPMVGMVVQEVYNETNFHLYLEHVKKEATFDTRGVLVLLDDEDKERLKDEERIADAREAAEEEAAAKAEAEEEEAELEEMRVELDGVTYLGYELGDKLFLLDELGEAIVGSWNFTSDQMDPYVEGEEDAEFEVEADKEAQWEEEDAAEAAAEEEAAAAALRAVPSQRFVEGTGWVEMNNTKTVEAPSAAVAGAETGAVDKDVNAAEGAETGAVDKDVNAAEGAETAAVDKDVNATEGAETAAVDKDPSADVAEKDE